MQRLLADRFHLNTHTKTRELPVFNLVVATGGLKMTPTPPPPAAEEGKRRNQGIRGGRGELNGMNCPIEVLVRVLSKTTHHLVVDKTGLTGLYNFKLTFTDENAQPSADNTDPFDLHRIARTARPQARLRQGPHAGFGRRPDRPAHPR